MFIIDVYFRVMGFSFYYRICEAYMRTSKHGYTLAALSERVSLRHVKIEFVARFTVSYAQKNRRQTKASHRKSLLVICATF